MLQNIFSEKQGKDFLKVNAFFSVIDFLNFLVEFIIIDCWKINEKKLKIMSLIISSIIQIFLLFTSVIYILYIFGFKFCKLCEFKIINAIVKYI